MPADRRCPQLPNATPTHIIEELPHSAVLGTDTGCRSCDDRLAGQVDPVGKTPITRVAATRLRAPHTRTDPRQLPPPPSKHVRRRRAEQGWTLIDLRNRHG